MSETVPFVRADSPNDAQTPVREATARDGLPRLAARIAAGQPVTAAFLGGSITEQAWYIRKFSAWWTSAHPRSALTVVNAGIAGMPSSVGVFRVGETVLNSKPDLVVVEFAVNDGDNPNQAARTRAAMEGIVRQLRSAQPSPDILFVYNARAGATGIEALRAGQLPSGAAAHEQVAAHYQIPSVQLAAFAAAEINAGRLLWAPATGAKTNAAQEESIAESARRAQSGAAPSSTPMPKAAAPLPTFTIDGVHPGELGGRLSAEAIARAFPALLAAAKPAAASLPAALESGSLLLARARLASFDQAKLTGWKPAPPPADEARKRMLRICRSLWVADAAGASATLKFTGTELSLFVLGGPDPAGPALTVSVDGGPPRTLPLSDRYTQSTKRTAIITLKLVENLPDAPHVVTLSTTGPAEVGYFQIIGEIIP